MDIVDCGGSRRAWGDCVAFSMDIFGCVTLNNVYVSYTNMTGACTRRTVCGVYKLVSVVIGRR